MLIPKHSRWLLPISMLVTPLSLAIEPPVDNAVPPAVAADDPAQEQVAQQQAFLGLVSGPIPEVLSTHLGVRNGEGVLVRSVLPEGPAAQAGIRAHDVIITLGDKPALSPLEVQNIIRSHRPGDRISIGVIQEGKGTDIAVTLGKRPDEVANRHQRPMGDLHQMDGIPEDMADRIRDMIEGNMMEFRFNGEPLNLGQGIPDIQQDMEQLREEMNQLRKQHRMQFQDGAVELGANTTIRLMDNEGSVELKSKDGDSELIVRDKDNNIQWQGPWNNDEDKAKAPDDIRKRAGNLKIGEGGLKFNFGR